MKIVPWTLVEASTEGDGSRWKWAAPFTHSLTNQEWKRSTAIAYVFVEVDRSFSSWKLPWKWMEKLPLNFDGSLNGSRWKQIEVVEGWN